MPRVRSCSLPCRTPLPICFTLIPISSPNSLKQFRRCRTRFPTCRYYSSAAITGSSVVRESISRDYSALLCASDATVCGRSTIVHQAMLAHTPLILYGWKVFDTYDAQVYAHTLPFVRTTRELVDTATRIFADPLYREELLVRQERFLEGYSFDGRASERIVELIRRLTHRQI